MSNQAVNDHTVIFGWGSFSSAPDHLARLGRRPLIMAGISSARRSGILDLLQESLRDKGCDPVIIEGIEAELRTDVVDAAAEMAHERGCDLVVGVGGGSVLDGAKAVAATTHSTSCSWDLTSWGRSDHKTDVQCPTPLPIACIPTVTGTGSEANGTGVLCNPRLREKAVFFDEKLRPRLALVDPALTVTVSPARTWAGAMDIIAHGVEDYLTQPSPDPRQSRKCLRLANQALEMAVRAIRDPRDREARTMLAQFDMEVWDGSYNGPETPWTLHAIAHVVGARLHQAHGSTIACLLPAWLAFIKEMDPKRLAGFCPEDEHALLKLARARDSVPYDTDALAREVVRTYGDNGLMPGWPGLTQRDLARFLEVALHPVASHKPRTM